MTINELERKMEKSKEIDVHVVEKGHVNAITFVYNDIAWVFFFPSKRHPKYRLKRFSDGSFKTVRTYNLNHKFSITSLKNDMRHLITRGLYGGNNYANLST